MERCICGKKLGKLANGKPAKTCKGETRRTCSGRLSKQHMLSVMKTSGTANVGITIAPREFNPFHDR